jgi:Ni/Co efflux regulator RcnB
MRGQGDVRRGRAVRCLLAVALAAVAAAPAAQEARREVIYGAEMMTRSEREDFRQDLLRAKTEEDSAKVRTRHREQMQKRAKARGETLAESGLLEKKK